MNRRAALLGGIAASIASVTAFAAVSLAHEGGPKEAPTPPWVTKDNGVDLTKMPAWMAVSGPDGQPLLDDKGLTYAVPTPAYGVQGSPPVPEGMVAAPGLGAERYEPPPPPPNADEVALQDDDEDVYEGGEMVPLYEEIEKAEDAAGS